MQYMGINGPKVELLYASPKNAGQAQQKKLDGLR